MLAGCLKNTKSLTKMKYPSYNDCPEHDVYASFGKGYSTEPKHSYSFLTGLLSLPQICNLILMKSL
jgi:hypothetical protein